MKRNDQRERRGSRRGMVGGGRSVCYTVYKEREEEKHSGWGGGGASQTNGAGRSGAEEKVEGKEKTDKLVNDGENSARGQREKDRKRHSRTSTLPATQEHA